MKRVVIYVEDKMHKTLRSILAMKGLTLSGWLRKVIEDYIKKQL